ncbi:MAG: ATP-binding cassette domain-containing protein, partial [Thermomicrobiales bacterium]
LGISGTTGSGKTTLCLTLNGLVPQQTSGTIRGDVWVGDWNTKRVRVPQLATRVGLVFQDPEANLLGLTVEDEVAFGPENLGVDPREIEERVTWALDVVGMTEQRRRSAALLSGGQKQRVGIAAVLAMLPRVLVLDEPTAELDPLGKREIVDVIAGLRERERGMAVVMVESDATTLARLADRLAIMDAGSIVALDEPGELYANPAALIERGVPVPDVSEVGLRLNQRLGTAWAFVTDDEALAALTADLQASAG